MALAGEGEEKSLFTVLALIGLSLAVAWEQVMALL
jgi:hypothetical protein